MRKLRLQDLKIIFSTPALKGGGAGTAENLDALWVHMGVPWPQGQHEHRQAFFQLFLLTLLSSKRDTKWVMWVWEDSSDKSSSELMENLLEKS